MSSESGLDAHYINIAVTSTYGVSSIAKKARAKLFINRVKTGLANIWIDQVIIASFTVTMANLDFRFNNK